MFEPIPSPVSRSFRNEEAHSTRPASTGRSNVKTRFATSPLSAIATTAMTRGCRRSTSIRWIVAVLTGGAVASASRSFAWARAAVVSRSASSTSRRACSSPVVGTATSRAGRTPVAIRSSA